MTLYAFLYTYSYIIIIIIISVLPSGRYLAPGPCLSLFSVSSLTGCCIGSRRDTHGVYRPWYFPQLLHIEWAHGIEGRFLVFVPYFLGDSFFLWRVSSSFLSCLLRSPFTISIGAV